jgi:hypothetical protein
MDVRSTLANATSLIGAVDPSTAGRVREMILREDEQQLSVEAFLVLVVDAVNGDGERTLSDEDVNRAARRRARVAGMIGMFGGKPGRGAASLFTEARLVCDVVDQHGLQLTDEEIAAHLLVLWKLSPDLEHAAAAIDGSGPSVARKLGSELAGDKRVDHMSPKEALKALWRLRVLFDDDALPGSSKIRHVAMPKRRVDKITETIERQLGVAAL